MKYWTIHQLYFLYCLFFLDLSRPLFRSVFFLFFDASSYSSFSSLLSFPTSPSSFADACYIWGTDSGICTIETLNAEWRAVNMPYCGNRVNYPACIPKTQQLPISREFPNGRWINYSTLEKDNWINHNCEQHIQYRIGLENNLTLRNAFEDEYGDRGKIIRRFSRRPDCKNAYRNLFCYINFPRCDPDRDLTLPTCRSACENFFKACVYTKDLWRCGQAKYFNGYFPEPSQLINGNITYLRDYFPGQPWRQNKFNKMGNDLPICTPAVKGGASSSYRHATSSSWYSMWWFCWIMIGMVMMMSGSIGGGGGGSVLSWWN